MAIRDDLISEEILTKLSQRREVKRPECFDVTIQSFRGVRSGVVRKIQSITTRINRGLPENRMAREQDKRAAKFLLAAFGSIFYGHMGIHTLRNVVNCNDRFGKMLVVARHIWMQDAYKNLQAGRSADLDELFQKYIETALKRLNTTVGDGVEKNDSFVIVSGLISQWLGNQVRTNHYVLSSVNQLNEDLTIYEDLKEMVRNETFAKVDQFGWKTVCRIRARCYKAIESRTLQALHSVRNILIRMRKGVSSLGSKGKHRMSVQTPISSELERHLTGLCWSTNVFISRQFDLRLAQAHSLGLL